MKLILTQDVPGLGAPGDVVEVKDGYGRNYLMPRGFAISWTRGGEKQVTQIKRARKVREVRDLSHANEIKQALEARQVELESAGLTRGGIVEEAPRIGAVIRVGQRDGRCGIIAEVAFLVAAHGLPDGGKVDLAGGSIVIPYTQL